MPPASSPPSKWVIYATYDPTGEVSPYVADQLTAHRSAGFKVLVVDTSPRLSAARRADWDAHAAAWFQRSNEGYDFKSFAAGLAHLQHAMGVDTGSLNLVLTNDSCYGPFVPLAGIVASFDAMPTDDHIVFGITDSLERRYHLQSYWLYFRANVTPLLLAFFEGLADISDRDEAIDRGELSLSDFMLAHGCRLVAYSPVAEVVEHYSRFTLRPLALLEFGARRLLGRPRHSRSGDGACWKRLLGRDAPCSYVNQMLDFAGPLVFERRLPFIKKRLLFENPNGEVSLRNFPPLAGLSNADIERRLRQSALLNRRYPKARRG